MIKIPRRLNRNIQSFNSLKRNYNFLSNVVENKLGGKIFLKDKYNQFSFEEVLNLSKNLSANLIKTLQLNDPNYLNQQKIGIYCSNNYSYLISILSIWILNGVPFVLNKTHPAKYIEQFIDDFNCKLVINGVDHNSANAYFDSMLEQKQIFNFKLDESSFHKSKKNCFSPSWPNIPNTFDEFRDFLTRNEYDKTSFLLATSGTSGKPKGVVISFRNLLSSIETMVKTYQWTPENHILNPLPLNHYSGLVYCFLTPFLSGASVDLLPKFDANSVWKSLLTDDTVNSFIAVPTIYTQLVNEYLNKNNLKTQFSRDMIINSLKRMKFIASGSAPLNVKTFNEWSELTKYPMVERYGMTEIGMALSTPLIERENFRRIGGTVGRPCGHVKVRIFDNFKNKVLIESDFENDSFASVSEDTSGELQINGPTVFKEYFNFPQLTKESFSEDGWFKTGDTAVYLKDLGVYKILGRTSVDVIKSGGHKISALDVEKEILAYDNIEDVAVIGLADPIWGQRVFALISLWNKTKNFDENNFLSWCKFRMPGYCVPRIVKIVNKIPKNQLGKVNKKELIQFYEHSDILK